MREFNLIDFVIIIIIQGAALSVNGFTSNLDSWLKLLILIASIALGYYLIIQYLRITKVRDFEKVRKDNGTVPISRSIAQVHSNWGLYFGFFLVTSCFIRGVWWGVSSSGLLGNDYNLFELFFAIFAGLLAASVVDLIYVVDWLMAVDSKSTMNSLVGCTVSWVIGSILIVRNIDK